MPLKKTTASPSKAPQKKTAAGSNKSPEKKPATKTTAKKAAPSGGKTPASVTAAPTKEPEMEPQDLGMTIKLGELSNELMGDTASFKTSGRWPLVLDGTGNAATFLKYRDVNMISAMDPSSLVPDTIRRAVIGALRYGKPMVLDLDDRELFDASIAKFDEVQKDLMEVILTKEILKEDKYMSLVKDSDGPEYTWDKFPTEVDKFTFVIITKISPTATLRKRTFVIEVQ